MKSIKSTFIRTLSLLLAIIMVLSIPISAFATTVTDKQGRRAKTHSGPVYSSFTRLICRTSRNVLTGCSRHRTARHSRIKGTFHFFRSISG